MIELTWWQWILIYLLALFFFLYINKGIGDMNKEWDRLSAEYHEKMVKNGYRKP